MAQLAQLVILLSIGGLEVQIHHYVLVIQIIEKILLIQNHANSVNILAILVIMIILA